MRATGTVKWFSEHKGYGFILGDDGQDAFLHLAELAEGFRPVKGDRVRYVGSKRTKGLRATEVAPEGDASMP